ncbi:hypothetical protein [Paenibacillus thermotolerans]|uniref:hypothetical protein n=1 Tax=Paenibacillus thermotolerans TaxID=3027807 RepID=UPI00236824F1|nr:MULTISPECIES: hypothetical protein [unclassified Paenibacillus]
MFRNGVRNRRLALTAPAIVIFLLLIAGAAVLLSLPGNPDLEIKELIEGSDFGDVRIFMKEEEVIELAGGGDMYLEGMGGHGREYKRAGLLLGFADDRDNRAFGKVTSIETTNPKHHLFGIRVGDSLGAAEEALKAKGYRKQTYDIWVKGELSVILENGGDRIAKIRVWFSDDKLKDRVY